MNKKNDKVYLKIDTRNVDRFATFVKLLYFFLILIIVVLIIGTLFLAGKTIYNYYHNIERRLNPNVLDELEDKYSKDFKIVDVSTDEDGFGVYTLYYKEDKNVNTVTKLDIGEKAKDKTSSDKIEKETGTQE